MAKKKSRTRKTVRLRKRVSNKKKSNKTMAKKRRRKSSSVRRALSASPRRRRKKRGFLSAMGGTGLMMSVKNNGLGAVGGLVPLATNFLPFGKTAKILSSYGLSILAARYVNPFVGAGAAGATTLVLAQSLFPSIALNDGDMEDAEYVDPNTLSDTGMCDENGYPIVQDEMGDAYALQDDGTLDPIALQEGSSLPSVSMDPLQDSYALQGAAYQY